MRGIGMNTRLSSDKPVSPANDVDSNCPRQSNLQEHNIVSRDEVIHNGYLGSDNGNDDEHDYYRCTIKHKYSINDSHHPIQMPLKNKKYTKLQSRWARFIEIITPNE